MYVGSRLPVASRTGPAPARVDRPRPLAANAHVHLRQQQLHNDVPNPIAGHQSPRRDLQRFNPNAPNPNAARPCGAARRATCDTPHNRPNPGSPCSAARRATRDAPINQPNPGGPCGGPCGTARRATCNAPPDQCRATCDVPPDQRRDTCDMVPNQPNPCGPCSTTRATCDAPPDQRRDIYDMVPEQPNPCGPSGAVNRGTYNLPEPAMNYRTLTGAGTGANQGSTLTVSGTISINTRSNAVGNVANDDANNVANNVAGNIAGNVAGNVVNDVFFPEHIPAQWPQYRESNDIMVEDFLDNQDRYLGIVAPRSIAVPDSPFVWVNEDASRGNTPENWHMDLSSIGSELRSMDISPIYNANVYDNSYDDNYTNDDSWSSRDSRPFGLDDSFEMQQGLPGSPERRVSRTASVDRGQLGSCRRRRDTFDRNTR